jgi:hypothetical protein
MLHQPLDVAHDDTAARLLSAPELYLVYGGAAAAFILGGFVVVRTYRWYRRTKQIETTAGEDLAQLAEAITTEAELAPEEVQRVRDAIERRMQKTLEEAGQEPVEKKETAEGS